MTITQEIHMDMECGCRLAVTLELIENPTDDEMLEAVTNPTLDPGNFLDCPDHHRQMIVKRL